MLSAKCLKTNPLYGIPYMNTPIIWNEQNTWHIILVSSQGVYFLNFEFEIRKLDGYYYLFQFYKILKKIVRVIRIRAPMVHFLCWNYFPAEKKKLSCNLIKHAYLFLAWLLQRKA